MSEIYRRRIQQLQKIMVENGIDAIGIIDLPNYIYYSGDIRKQPRLYIPSSGEPLLVIFKGEEDEVKRNSWIKNIATYTNLHEMMKAVMAWIEEHRVKKMGFDMEFSLPAFLLQRFRMAVPNVEVVDARDILMEQRMIKNEDEIRLIKKAQEIAIIGMKKAEEVLSDGIKEYELTNEIEYAMRKAGAEAFSFHTFVNSGYRSSWLHGLSTRKEIGRKETILIDVGPVYMGYCGDMTRMFYTGKADEKLRDLVKTYLKARNVAVEKARPGSLMMDLDNAVQGYLSKMGFVGHFVRGIAHGIGLAFEEKPFPTIFPQDTMIELRSNMTLSIGHSILYRPEVGGVRVEDIYLITEEGAQILTNYSGELIEV